MAANSHSRRRRIVMTLTRPLVITSMMMSSIVMLAYDQQLRALADALNQRLATSGKTNIAVVDFTDLQGSTTELGRFLAEELSVNLAVVAKGYRVIDRTHLKAILQEHKLASTGIIDPLTARKLGQIAGVDTIVTGTITPFGESVRLAVKVLDTSTAEMLTASTTDIPKTKAVDELLARGIGGNNPWTQPALGRPISPVAGMSAQRVNAGGLAFELQGCRGGGAVTCHLFVVASEDDQLSSDCCPASRVFDADGNELGMTELRIGNNFLRSTLVANVRTRIIATFIDNSGRGGTPAAASRSAGLLSLIAFKLVNRSGSLEVQFRNVPLAQ